MATDARAALDRLVSALEEHLVAAQRRRSDADPAVERAYTAVADAFEAYDDALFDAHGEATPLVLYDDVEDGRDDAEDDQDAHDDEDEDDDDDEDDDEDDLEDDDDVDEDDLTADPFDRDDRDVEIDLEDTTPAPARRP